MPRRRVAIVGGGIAGLTLASALDPARCEVTLYEAQPERRGTGAALGIWPAARRALERLDAWGPIVGAAGALPVETALHDGSGRRLIGLPEAPVTMIPRAHLMDALTRALPSSVRIETSEVTHPGELDADLVVGADGVRSRVRGLVWPPAADRLETPYVALRGILDHTTQGCDGYRLGEYWGQGALFGIVPVAGDRAYWFTAHRSDLRPEPLDPADVLAEVVTRFEGASPTVRDVLAAAQWHQQQYRHQQQPPPEQPLGSAVLATRLWVTAPMPRYIRGRYVVIGDAAHASLPNLGRGACDAILDAATLAAALNRDGPLLRWQARRLPFTQAARIGASWAMGVALASRGAAARNQTLRTLGALTRSR